MNQVYLIESCLDCPFHKDEGYLDICNHPINQSKVSVAIIEINENPLAHNCPLKKENLTQIYLLK